MTLLTFTFQENIRAANKPVVTVLLGNQKWGDPLTDNAYKEDFYRYHDIFHFGLYALTGWSPVTEQLLKANGKKWPSLSICRQERPLVTEECLSATIFFLACKNDYFRDCRPGKEYYQMLQDIADETPLADMTSDEWLETLQEIYTVFNKIVDQRGGTVELDCETKHFRCVS